MTMEKDFELRFAAEKELLHEILSCENIVKSRGQFGYTCPCYRIVNSQPNNENCQLPEPWCGRLSVAPILFLSSNPSIDEDEQFPTAIWKNDKAKLEDFYLHRFTTKRKPQWVKDNRILLKDGTYSKNWVRFWAGIGKRAEELLQREPLYGEDFVMTEVVKCKSKSEFGVSEAVNACAGKYMKKMLEISPAKMIVVLGRHAREQIIDFLKISPWDAAQNHLRKEIAGKERLIVFLPAPNAFQAKTFAARFTQSELNGFREYLKK